MRIGLVLLCFGCLLALGYGQDDGRYRPSPAELTTQRPRYNPYVDGRYLQYNPYRYPAGSPYYNRNDGRYVNRNDGRYVPYNDGRYTPGNDGRYIHVDNKYKHIEGRAGSGAGNQGGSGGGGGGGGGAGRGAGSGLGVSRIGGTNGDEGATTKAAVVPAPVPTTTPVPTLVRNKIVPQAPVDGWKIIRLENQVKDDGYHYVFETEDGFLAEEAGRLEDKGTAGEALRSQGFYQYIGDDGVLYRVDYVADGNGYVPQGDHIPKVPPAIEKLLQYLASQPK